MSGNSEDKTEPRLRLIGEDGKEIKLISETEAEQLLERAAENKTDQDYRRKKERERKQRQQRNSLVRKPK